MTYPHAHPQPPVPAPTAKPKPGGFAVTALVLGIIGVVLSYMPIINNLTAAGAFVGLVLGIIGLWRSKPVMSAIGSTLCAVAIVLTVLAQTQLVEDLEKIGAEPAPVAMRVAGGI